MALSEFETKRFQKALTAFIELKRPPAHIRNQVDLAGRISGQSIEVYEIRPGYRDPSVTMESSIAKATYVKKLDAWKVFWMRADLKWHSYEPAALVNTLDEFFAVIEADEYCCFWG